MFNSTSSVFPFQVQSGTFNVSRFESSELIVFKCHIVVRYLTTRSVVVGSAHRFCGRGGRARYFSVLRHVANDLGANRHAEARRVASIDRASCCVLVSVQFFEPALSCTPSSLHALHCVVAPAALCEPQCPKCPMGRVGSG
jgi:hypothetical protein